MLRILTPAIVLALSPLLTLAGDPASPILPEVRPSSTPLKASVRDSFRVTDLPQGTRKVRAWFELPIEEALQKVSDLKVSAPDGYQITRPDAAGNRFLYVEIADPTSASFDVVVTFTLERWESEPPAGVARVITPEEKRALEPWLAEFPNGETTEKIREKARSLAEGTSDPVEHARRFYNYIIDHAEYWKKDPEKLKPSGRGSAEYCFDCQTGNCTDFHALYQAMARVVDLPTQFIMGTALKKDLDGVEKFDGSKKEPNYHCWVRTYFPGRGWVYSDVSYADADPSKREYYFDRIDAQRVSFCVGRNIELTPKQDGPRLNWFIKCYVEADGKEHTGWTRELTWRTAK